MNTSAINTRPIMPFVESEAVFSIFQISPLNVLSIFDRHILPNLQLARL
jgi:hypothetical protein